MSDFFLYLRREWLILLRDTSALVYPTLFFVIAVLLFPFASGANAVFLPKIGGAVIWVCALLATLLGLEQIFKGEYRDGVLEQLLITPSSVLSAIYAKLILHWCISGLIVSLLSPLLSLSFNIPGDQIWLLFGGLMLGTPSLVFIGAIGAALTVTLERSGLLIAVIILPFYVPILIFGASMLVNTTDVTVQLYALASILALSLSLAPLAIWACLKTTIE